MRYTPAAIESITAHIARVFLMMSRARQIDLSDVFAAHDVAPAQLADPDTRIPHALGLALWQAAEQRWGGPCLGVQMARDLPFGSNQVALNLVINCPTLRRAHAQWGRYGRLMNPYLRTHLTERGPVARYAISTTRDATHAWMEFLLGRVARFFRAATMDVDLAFTQVTLRRTEHAAVRAIAAELFAAPVVMGADEYAVSFPAAWLDRPLVCASPRLLEAATDQAERALAVLHSPNAFVDRVRRCIVECTATAEPTVERVARQLAVSPRSLQRKLKRAGTSFHQLRDDTRLALATRYLADRHTSITEIAFLLGFAEVSAFYRAFRRWTGTTPRDYALSLTS